MFKATRVLWVVNKRLSDVLFECGEHDKTLAGKIVGKEEIGDGELSFMQEVEVFHRRSVKETALMVLVETAAAWRVADNDQYAYYCFEAAKRLLDVWHAEKEPERQLFLLYKERFSERLRELGREDEI